jgi:hypothetical protein
VFKEESVYAQMLPIVRVYLEVCSSFPVEVLREENQGFHEERR